MHFKITALVYHRNQSRDMITFSKNDICCFLVGDKKCKNLLKLYYQNKCFKFNAHPAIPFFKLNTP